jgi:6,7-dimethyl-8-ribityllumazine synthase
LPEFDGQLRPVGRVVLIVSRYNELVTGKLLAGARACCKEAGIADDQVDTVWVPGAFELGVASLVLETGVPVGFGLLTTEDMDQALARAGGAAGNKGHEACDAAIRAADVVRQLREAR